MDQQYDVYRKILGAAEEVIPMLRPNTGEDRSSLSFTGSRDYRLRKLQTLCSKATANIDLRDYRVAEVWYWFRKEYWAPGPTLRHIEVAPTLKMLRDYRRRSYPATPGPSMRGLAMINLTRPIAVMIRPFAHFGQNVQLITKDLGPIGL